MLLDSVSGAGRDAVGTIAAAMRLGGLAVTGARWEAFVRLEGELLGGQFVKRRTVERDGRCLLFGQTFACTQPGIDCCRRMLGRCQIAHALLHGQSDQTWRLAQR